MKKIILLLVAGLSLIICCDDEKLAKEKNGTTNESNLAQKSTGSTLEETITAIVNSWLTSDSIFVYYSDKMVRKEAHVWGIKTDDIQQIRKQLDAQFKEDREKLLEETPEFAPVEITHNIQDREDISKNKCKLKLIMKSKLKDGSWVSSTAIYVFVKIDNKWLVDEILPSFKSSN